MIEFVNWIEKLLIVKPNEDLSFVLTNFVYWNNEIIDVPIKVLRIDIFDENHQFLYVQVPYQQRWELVYSEKTNQEIATKLIIDGIRKIRDIVACFEISRKVHLGENKSG
ncbi:MAG: hypothetical protein R2830_01080 [Saprospiraceae bacterium]